MAPKRTSLRPTRKNRAAFVGAVWAGVVKSRSEARSLRRFKNGLLDVSRKSGQHLAAIKANSETPLLRLPPEVRSRIWEYALGDKVFDVVFVEKLKGPYIEEKTLIAAETFPDHSHALLQVCRQVYTETALIPFATNAFKFAREEAFDWARYLLPVQQKSIREVHIVTHRAERMLDWMHCDGHEKYMPDAFPLEVFPNVKNIVIKVGYSFIHNFTAGDDLTMEKQDELIREYIGKITAYVKEVRPDAKLTFEHVNIKNDKEVDSDYESEGLHSVDLDEI